MRNATMQMTSKSLQLSLDGMERGTEMLLPTDGTPLKVVVGTSSGYGNRPKERGVFTLDDAQSLKRKRGFSHDDMVEVRFLGSTRRARIASPT